MVIFIGGARHCSAGTASKRRAAIGVLPANVLVLVVVLSITASYFLANNAFGYSVLGETVAGNQAAQQTLAKNVLTSLQKGMLVFYLLDAGIYLLLLWRQNRPQLAVLYLRRVALHHSVLLRWDRVRFLHAGVHPGYLYPDDLCAGTLLPWWAPNGGTVRLHSMP